MDKEMFNKYRRRVVRDAVLKSFLISLVIGCACATAVELCSWFFGFKAGLYLALGVLVAVTLVSSIIFYFKKYKPTTKAIAARIDELGLEERVLTMIELDGDDSYIASAQRDDTMKALGTVNHMMIKFAVSLAMAITIFVCGFLFAGMTTVNALYVGNVIPSGVSLMRGKPPVHKYVVRYTATTGGAVYYYSDDWSQAELFKDEVTVKEGEDISMVIAVADAGYVFVGWSDNGSGQPARHDTDIGGNIKAVARFEKVVEPTLEEDVGYDDYMDFHNGSSGDGKPDPNAPKFPNESQDQSNSVGDRDASSNQTDDGNTYYGDSYGEDYEGAMQGGSQENQDIVDGYFEGINPPSSEGPGGGN